MKRIEEIDPNFRLDSAFPMDYVYFDPREDPFRIDGLAPNAEGSYCRLDLDFLPQCREGVQWLAWHLAGGCIRFSTDSSGINLLFELREAGNMPHFPPSGQSGMELFEETDHGCRLMATIIPQMNEGLGCQIMQSHHVALPGGMRHYALYLPLYNGVRQLALGFVPGAQVTEGRVPAIEKPLLFYGSSITQGGCASKAGSCYPAILARRLDAVQRNLGFSGNAMGEESMARYIAGQEMSAFIMDYDANSKSPETLLETHEPFYRIVRQVNPDLPIILVSRPDFDSNISYYRLRRNMIMRTYARALAAGDRRIYFVDGEQLFGTTDRELCTVDGIHPTDLGFLRMADHIEPILRHALGI